MRSSLAVAAGAAIGAGARWAVGEVLATDGFPWATLLVNLVGAAAIGFAAVRLVRGTVAWSFVVTGLLGGLTTASAFGVDTRGLLDDGRVLSAVTYVAVSVAGSLVATSIARTEGQRW
jgi:CrcB protein